MSLGKHQISPAISTHPCPNMTLIQTIIYLWQFISPLKILLHFIPLSLLIQAECLTAIEVWMLFCILFVFAALVE